MLGFSTFVEFFPATFFGKLFGRITLDSVFILNTLATIAEILYKNLLCILINKKGAPNAVFKTCQLISGRGRSHST